jgi:hypothetical protein
MLYDAKSLNVRRNARRNARTTAPATNVFSFENGFSNFEE